MSQCVPIIFIHRYNSPYLKYSLEQAKVCNPEVFLIGDNSNNLYNFVTHIDYRLHFDEAREFSKIYKHYSTSSYEYEMFNFQRWFILKDFVIKNKINACLYLDSDVMIYVDVSKEIKKFKLYNFTLSQYFCGCVFFLNDIDALKDFCEFIMNIYSKKDKYHFSKMKSHYKVRKKHGLPGGACDMTAFELYHQLHFGEIGEVSQIIDNSVYDPAINISFPGFVMENGVKKIIWKNGVPYGIHKKTHQLIRFNSLHFQGKSKKIMSRYLSIQHLE